MEIFNMTSNVYDNLTLPDLAYAIVSDTQFLFKSASEFYVIEMRSR